MRQTPALEGHGDDKNVPRCTNPSACTHRPPVNELVLLSLGMREGALTATVRLSGVRGSGGRPGLKLTNGGRASEAQAASLDGEATGPLGGAGRRAAEAAAKQNEAGDLSEALSSHPGNGNRPGAILAGSVHRLRERTYLRPLTKQSLSEGLAGLLFVLCTCSHAVNVPAHLTVLPSPAGCQPQG